jgi:hypothetical protein
LLDEDEKGVQIWHGRMPASARQADTGPKRVQSPFGRKTCWGLYSYGMSMDRPYLS